MNERKAIVDLGTNTFNLLVFEHAPEAIPSLLIIQEEERPVFLGKGGIEKAMITDEAIERGIAVLKDFRAIASSHHAVEVKGIGTSALRNAGNAKIFVEAAAELGIKIEIIPGEEEASLILDGVRAAVPIGNRPALIMDIGGGSIEFILATDKALMWKQSFELGVTRLRERLPVSDPVSLDEELRIAEHLDAQLEPLWSVIERHTPHVLIGSAGSFDSLRRMISGEGLTGNGTSAFFEADRFHELKDRLMRMDRNERSAVPGLPEHRVDTILYAMIAIERVLIAGGIRDMAWSRYSLKEGAAMRAITP